MLRRGGGIGALSNTVVLLPPQIPRSIDLCIHQRSFTSLDTPDNCEAD